MKRRPTLRIILLAAIAITVYLKFDGFVASPAFRKIQNPRALLSAWFPALRPGPEKAATGMGLRWDADSGFVESECRSDKIDSCLQDWQALGPEALGRIRAALAKTEAQWRRVPTRGFTARFRRMTEGRQTSSDNGLRLAGLEIRDTDTVVSLSRVPESEGSRLCAGGRCLDSIDPKPPFANTHALVGTGSPDVDEARIAQATLSPADGSPARPILGGRIVAVPTEAGSGWLKIYHGGTLFSYYRGLAKWNPGLKAGDMVDAEDTLGSLSTDADSLAGLEIRIEKDGLLMDPLAFLGLRPESEPAGTGDGR